MGLYHSVAVAYGFEIDTTTDLDQLDKILGDDHIDDSVGRIVVGDLDRLLLVTRYMRIEENNVGPIAPDTLATVDETTAWNEALHAVAAHIGQASHPQAGWLVIHNYC